MLKDKVKKTFEVFENTPFGERLEDINRQFFDLIRFTDLNNLKQATGNLMASLIQLCNESGWDFNEVVEQTLKTIDSRKEQYKSLGRKKRIALYGGAFNPVQNGHIEVAKFVLKTAKVDEVWLVPAFEHMYNKEMVSTTQRLKMCELSVQEYPNIRVFDYEIGHELKGETYKFIKKLLSDNEYDNFEFFMVIGQDNANNFHEWYNFEHLQKLLPFIIVPRKGIDEDKNVDWYKQKPHIYLNKETDIPELSSTDVRQYLTLYSDNSEFLKPLGKMMNKDVLEYIIERALYFKEK